VCSLGRAHKSRISSNVFASALGNRPIPGHYIEFLCVLETGYFRGTGHRADRHIGRYAGHSHSRSHSRYPTRHNPRGTEHSSWTLCHAAVLCGAGYARRYPGPRTWGNAFRLERSPSACLHDNDGLLVRSLYDKTVSEPPDTYDSNGGQTPSCAC